VSTLLSWVALWALGFVRASVRARTGGCGSGISLTKATSGVTTWPMGAAGETLSTMLVHGVPIEVAELQLQIELQVVQSRMRSDTDSISRGGGTFESYKHALNWVTSNFHPEDWQYVLYTALGIFELEGQVPESRVKGEPADISTISEYEWYEWVKFCDTSTSFPVSKVHSGRYVGAVIDIGPVMARKILKANGEVMYCAYVRSFTPEEIASPVEKQARLDFDIEVEQKLGPSMTKYDFKEDPDFADFESPEYEPYEDDEVPATHMPDIDDVHDVDTYNQYVCAQVRAPICDEIRTGRVMRHKHELDGTVKGMANKNAILDKITYEMEFPDGRSDECTANMIAENMSQQYDQE
jgi:hypothetical protein